MTVHFGITLKKIRLQRGLTLAEVASNTLSIAQLSRFENGQTMLTVDRFLDCLDRLNLTFAEFQKRHLTQREPQWHAFLSKLELFPKKTNLDSLEELQKNVADFSFDLETQKLMTAFLQGLLSLNDPQRPFTQLTYLQNYFSEIETWHPLEIRQYMLIFSLFKPDFNDRLFSKILHILEPTATQTILFQLSMLSYWFYHHQFTKAAELLHQLELLVPRIDHLSIHLEIRFSKGILALLSNKIPDAIELFDQVLSLCQIFSQTTAFLFYRNRKEIWLKYIAGDGPTDLVFFYDPELF